MATHVKILGILHIILAGLTIAGGLFVLALFGGVAAVVGSNADPEGARIAIPILGTLGVVIFTAAAVLALPGLIAGFGLLAFKPWARILTIILSGFELLNVPFGTALGVYGLWVLLNTGTERLFDRTGAGHPVRA